MGSNITTVGGIASTFLDADESPSVFRMALEFLNADTSRDSMQAFLQNSSDLSASIQQRAAVIAALQELPANSTLSTELATGLNELGVSATAGQTVSQSDIDTWSAQLDADQAEDNQALQGISTGIGESLDRLNTAFHSTNMLLQQFAPGQIAQVTEYDHHSTQDIVLGIEQGQQASRNGTGNESSS